MIAACAQSTNRVRRRNDPSEQNTLDAGEVSLTPAGFSTVWAEFAAANRHYCDNLDYAFLVLSRVRMDFNFNGYVVDVSDFIDASTDAPLHTYCLGDRPVPPGECAWRECTKP